MVLPAIASAVIGQVAGGLAGKLFGGGTSVAKQVGAQGQIMRLQDKLAREFDATAIQRRVADAKLAGVSPMAGLGMTPSGGSPAYVGGNIDYQSVNGDDRGLGQNVGRAIAAAADPMTRLNMRLLNSQIDGQDLDNEYKRSMIMHMGPSQMGPSMPGVSSGASDDGQATPMYSTVMTPSGPRRMVSPEYGQVLENDISEFLRYIPRDFKDRADRFATSFKKWWLRKSFSSDGHPFEGR